MTATRAKAPTLAWLLTALACLLSGMAIVEGRYQSGALPVLASLSDIPPGAISTPPTAAPTPTNVASLLVEDTEAPVLAKPGSLRGERLVVPPGVHVVPAVESDPMLLMAETGELTLRATYAGQRLDTDPGETALRPGEPLVIPGGAYFTVRNDDQTPATLFVVTIIPAETGTTDLVPAGPRHQGSR